MKTKKENNKMETFDEKVAQIFQEKLPEMPRLTEETDDVPEILELDREELDLLQAAGEPVPPADIIRFLNPKKKAGGIL